jgi:hypothetical protein
MIEEERSVLSLDEDDYFCWRRKVKQQETSIYFWKKKIIYLVVDLSFTFSLDEGENEFSIKNIIYPIHRELKQTINILFWEKLLKIVH